MTELEARKFDAEIAKIMADTVKLSAETMKLQSEAAQLNELARKHIVDGIYTNTLSRKAMRETFWHPLFIATGLIGAIGTVAVFLTKALISQ
jgi:hypothetical protein